MTYTTTKCSNCGYATRIHQSNVPKVQLGSPIQKCPNCGHLGLDSIATEYEFMSVSERERFLDAFSSSRSYPGQILFIILGIFLGIGISTVYTALGILIGLGMVGLGIYKIACDSKFVKDKIPEQMIYESLQRTSIKEYVDAIEKAYESAGIKRQYAPFADKQKFMEENKDFESRESYKQDMDDFNKILEAINLSEITQNKQSTFIHH